jgi:hypothetical protein
VSGGVPDIWWSTESLQEMQSLLGPSGRLCAQVDLAGPSAAAAAGGRPGAVNPAAIINSINSNGLTVEAWQLLRPQPGAEATQLRLVARPHELHLD